MVVLLHTIFHKQEILKKFLSFFNLGDGVEVKLTK